MQRVFLNWDMPVLETAANYLVRRYFVDEQVDLRNVRIVVTGSKAKRRLEELLQQKAAELDPAWFPPERMTTIGTFPELLYPQKKPAASDIVQQLAWSTAIDKLSRKNPKSLHALTEQLPKRGDWSGRITLGRLVAQLHLELAADRVDFDVVAEYCRSKNISEEAARWDVLAELQKLYVGELDAAELWDIQMAREFALIHNECATDYDIILIGLSDLNNMQRAMLDEVESRVTSLVFAPESLADMFDQHGCVIAEKWHDHKFDIPDSLIEQADTPASQATAVLHWLQQLNAQYAAQDIVIGVPDETVVPFLTQQLGQVDIAHRLAAGTPIAQTPVFMLLESLSSYLQTRRYYDLMTLLRHPDVERFVNKQLRQEAEADAATVHWQSWLVEFDTYYQDHLPLTVTGNWLPKPRRETEDDSELNVMRDADVILNDGASSTNVENDKTSPRDREYHHVKKVYDIIEGLIATLFEKPTSQTDDTIDPNDLLAEDAYDDSEFDDAVFAEPVSETSPEMITFYDPDTKRKPVAWCETLHHLLERLYGSRKLSPIVWGDHIVAKSLEQLGRMYEKLAEIPKCFAPMMKAADMLSVLTRMWNAERIPPMPGENEIELLGWLELLTDDTPAIVVTGLNEGIVPTSKSADAFLPDSMRHALRLEDNMRRYARDAYALSAMIASRENVRLILGRRSVEGDPLVPSRLFFAADETQVAKRVRRFFGEPQADAVRPVFTGSLHAGQKKSQFDPLPPQLIDIPFDTMRVTEFRDYLQCPFRYYLKHRLRLNIVDDIAEELNGGAFGDITHQVLKLFGRSKVKDSTNAGKITDYLCKQLDAVVADSYGAAFRPVIGVQVEQIRKRLAAFAVEQAKRTAAGFEILYVEYSPPTPDGETLIDVDGKPIKIRGRIDRVDFDHNSGKYVLLDYKTSGAGDDPERVHRRKGEWADLQLPLYEWLFAENNNIETGIDVGYVSLPKDTSKTGFLIADWHYQDFEDARETARGVIRNIRNEVFWPMTMPPPKYSEAFSPICNDRQIRLFEEDNDNDE